MTTKIDKTSHYIRHVGKPTKQQSITETISKKMGWWSPNGFDAYPEKTEKVLSLIDSEIVKELEEIVAKYAYFPHDTSYEFILAMAVRRRINSIKDKGKDDV